MRGDSAQVPFFEALRCVAFFLALYLTLQIGPSVISGTSPILSRELSLLCAIIATATSIRILERGRWNLGLRTGASSIVSSSIGGILFAIGIVLAADAILCAISAVVHYFRGVFPLGVALVLIIPAAVKEEILFRGYPFQKLLGWNRSGAMLIGASLFALLHLANRSVSYMAIANLFAAGLMLSAGYLATGTLWFPIAMHVSWNLLMGPVLGYAVGGIPMHDSLFATLLAPAPHWINGGHFGLEGSVVLLPLEAAGTIFLLLIAARRDEPPAAAASSAPTEETLLRGEKRLDMEKR